MSDLYQLIPTSLELFQQNPLSMLSDLFSVFSNSKLTFNDPIGTFSHVLCMHVKEFYHLLPSNYHIVNQYFALVYLLSRGEMVDIQSQTVLQLQQFEKMVVAL